MTLDEDACAPSDIDCRASPRLFWETSRLRHLVNWLFSFMASGYIKHINSYHRLPRWKGTKLEREIHMELRGLGEKDICVAYCISMSSCWLWVSSNFPVKILFPLWLTALSLLPRLKLRCQLCLYCWANYGCKKICILAIFKKLFWGLLEI